MKRIVHILALLWVITASGESFEFMIAPTRQDASLDWWYAVPEPFTPQLSLISSVTKGEYFNIIPIFSNYAVNTHGHAKISYDIEILRPDGSTDEALKNCAGHEGHAAPPNRLAARAVLRLCFDPDDPYGKYTINITAYDHIASQTNRQSITIEQKEFKLATLSEKEREELFLRYPTAPTPSLALAAFLQTEHSFFDEGHEPLWSAIWFFKTVFENNDYLLPHLIEAFRNSTRKQQKDIILVLALMGKTDELPILPSPLKDFEHVMQAGRIPDPYAKITTGNQLDMLWAEYFATGRVKPIRHLVTSLSLGKYRGTLDQIKVGDLDPKNEAVYRNGRLEAVFQSALWSLRSNCAQSSLIFPYCVSILDSKTLKNPEQHLLSLLLKSIASVPKKPAAPTE